MTESILENGHLQVVIPIKLRTISARHKIIPPEGSADETEPIVLALARAFRWQEFLDKGKFEDVRGLAKALGLDESNVARVLRMRLLSPKIIHRIVSGDIPSNFTLNALRKGVPDVWREQEKQYLGE